MRSLSGLAALVAALLLGVLPLAAAPPPGGTFIDDDGNPHEAAIEAIRTAGVTEGCDPVGDLFCPDQAVTRAQMAAFLVRALGETPVDPVEGSFPDVGADAWYAGHVERLARLGITSGYADGTFRPDAPVSRGEMAVFLVRSLDQEDSLGAFAGTFADVASGAFYSRHAERLEEMGVTRGCATDPLRYCPFDAVTRDQMASFLARAFDLPIEAVPPRPSVQGLSLSLQTVASGFQRPVFATSPPGDPRLFVLEQRGVIWIVEGGQTSAEPFLDIQHLVQSGGEQGLLGLAFHPDFATNGRFFVDYTDTAGDTRIVEYFAPDAGDQADEGSARILLTVDQPASNHNGGMLAFGPDGLLYIAFGDGGGAGDQFGNGQDPATALGTISRLDVDSPARETFAFGLRNPWRFSFDGARLYIADVGQSAWEEVDVITTSDAGANLGWPIMEGAHCFRSSTCSTQGLVLPVVEYPHSQGCSITGGYVYRGSAIPELTGHYFYGDFCSGFIRSFRYDGSGPSDAREWPFSVEGLTSFGVDASGELYTTSTDGTVRKLVPAG